MRKVISYFVLTLVIGLLFGLGCSAAGKSAEGSSLQATAGELIISGYSFTINPCLYTYEQNATEVIKTTVSNLSSKEAVFDMGDGQTLVVPADSSREYEYRIQLKGQTERVRITKLVENQSGLSIQEALVLKIEPK